MRRRFRHVWRWIAPVLFCAHLLLSQSAESFSHQAWSTEEGLPASGVHQILQSKDGYLWLATEGGAVRFDGVSFTTYRQQNQPAFASDDVTSLAEDSAGNLWFGTADGITEWSGGVFTHVAGPEGAYTSVQSLAVASRSVLALTGGGVLHWDGSRFRQLAHQPANVSALGVLPSSDAWMAADGVLYRMVDGHVVPLSNGPGDRPVEGLQTDPRGKLWAWSANGVYELRAGSRRAWRAGKELPAGRLTAFLVDRNGTAWIGTTHGLFTMPFEEGAHATAVDALRGESIAALLQDREGSLWVGTEGSGLHVLRRRIFRSEPLAAGEGVTTVVTAADGTTWYGTRGEGVHAITASGLQTPVAPAALTSPIILSMAPGRQKDVWAGTPDGLNHIDGQRVEQFTSSSGLPDDFVRSVLVDTGQVVWAGTRRGLVRLDHGNVRTLTTSDGLGSDSVGPLVEIPGSGRTTAGLWVGTSSGVSHSRGERFESFTPGAIAEKNITTALADDRSSGLWVAVHKGGLLHFQDGAFQRVSSPLLPDEVVGIVVDRRGFVWIRGTHAVYRVAQNDLLGCLRQTVACDASVASFTSADGMPSDGLAGEGSPAAWQDESDRIWIASKTGIAVANAASFSETPSPPPVKIERFRVDESDMPVSGEATKVGPGHNRFVFDFVALSYAAPSKNRYRYMLEGFDRNWIEAGSGRLASYTNLPAGHYVFRVQAANNNGVWNRAGASLTFRVLPPVYRRWWFYLLLAVLLGGIALGIYQLRVRYLERRFALVLSERNRVAREVHDTLAQDFVSVSLQLDLATALLKTKQYDEVGAQIQATRKLVKEGLEDARQSIWNLRANASESSLPARLTALASKIAEPNKPRLKIGGAYRPLPATIEAEVFRIAQESISNIQRHAHATEASMELRYETEALRLTIRDNGRGFSPEQAARLQGHYGVRGMHERAATIEGTFTIQSEPGQGTTVCLLIPLPEREGAQT